ncbi:hypothetical protein Scep_015708 [Stephania cephalantha]|uniref:Uncharacterized protein n=1 Tax=Stephania cephalantha TaxID=152367 RepID=A0AAP0P0N3_9MAGN
MALASSATTPNEIQLVEPNKLKHKFKYDGRVESWKHVLVEEVVIGKCPDIFVTCTIEEGKAGRRSKLRFRRILVDSESVIREKGDEGMGEWGEQGMAKLSSEDMALASSATTPNEIQLVEPNKLKHNFKYDGRVENWKHVLVEEVVIGKCPDIFVPCTIEEGKAGRRSIMMLLKPKRGDR